MGPSRASSSASTTLPVVILYRGGHHTAPRGHEIDTLRELGRQIAALRGAPFAGEFDEAQVYLPHRYWIPADTLTRSEARKLGVGSMRDLYGGVAPYPVVATKLIAHGLFEGARCPLLGWSSTFSARTASLVLPGYSVFSRDDARRAALALLDGGRVRIKRADGSGGAGQTLVASEEELEAALDALGDEVFRAVGVVIERHLREVETISVGQVWGCACQRSISTKGGQHRSVPCTWNTIWSRRRLLEFPATATVLFAFEGQRFRRIFCDLWVTLCSDQRPLLFASASAESARYCSQRSPVGGISH
ncbi:hypothetical protein R1479_01423 [Ralstonia mannitolilytica]|nr:hypothetical protein R1479_01423 [Ralstonia mannitolilytica]